MFRQTLSKLSLMALLCVTLGCSDKEEPAPDPTAVKCLLLNEQTTGASGSFNINRTFIFKGELMSQVTEARQGTQTSNVTIPFVYNTKGEVVSTTVIDEQGLPVESFQFAHDASGLVTQVDMYTKWENLGPGVTSLFSTKEYTYNSKKQLINCKNWFVGYSSRFLLNDFNFTYDAKGNVSKVVEYRVVRFQTTNQDSFNDIVIKVDYTYDDKINPYQNVGYMKYLPTGLYIPGLSPNNILTANSVTTLEGTKKGPGTYNTNPFNYNNSNTYTYTEMNRPATMTSTNGTFRSFTYKCE